MGSFFTRCDDYNVPHGEDENETIITIVCISDTHGHHRFLNMPRGDILIHAGDYTLYGNKSHAEDFNSWLGTLDYKHILVVQGNHECNAEWKNDAVHILSNATLLQHESIALDLEVAEILTGNLKHVPIRIFGTMFNWPCSGENPYFAEIPSDTNIVISHCPVYGYVDIGRGCRALRNCMLERVRPKLVVSGHIHSGYGVTVEGNMKFVNAANAGQAHQVTKQPIEILLKSKSRLENKRMDTTYQA